MSGTVSIDALLDSLAERVAEKMRSATSSGRGSGIQPRLLTVEQAAAYLGRSKASVQHLVAHGALPTVRFDRRVFLDVHDLDGWIERAKG